MEIEKQYFEETYYICAECLYEAYLKKIIQRSDLNYECSFCNTEAAVISLDIIVGLIEKAVLTNYEPTPDQPTYWQEALSRDCESDYEWARDGQTFEELLLNEFGITAQAAKLIQEVLKDHHSNYDYGFPEEDDFDDERHYTERAISDEYWQHKWTDFVNLTINKDNGYEENSVIFLEEMFKDLEKYSFGRYSNIRLTIGPDRPINSLFRARCFEDSDLDLLAAIAKPDQLLGTPSEEYASRGRMNEKGHPVFYGATAEDLTICEVRPPVGSKVAVAKFNILRELNLLDLRELKSLWEQVSVFDPRYEEKKGKIVFLRGLGEMLSRPIMPNQQDRDYQPTQFIANYLANLERVEYDGIIFRSSQYATSEAANVVLFNKAALIRPVNLPKNIATIAYDTEYHEEGEYISYFVQEHKQTDDKRGVLKPNDRSDKRRIPSLEVDINNISIQHVKEVAYSCDSFSVDWRRPVDFGDFGDDLFFA